MGLVAAALLAVPLFLAAPPTSVVDARRYLDPAASIARALPPGESIETPPSWTAWVAYPVAAVETIRALGAHPGPEAARFAAATGAWMTALRLLWAWLFGLVLIEAASFALVASKRAAWFPLDVPHAVAIAGAAFLAVSPLAAIGIAHLLPAVPASLLLFLLLRSRGYLRTGLLAGMLLAWFGFLWPLVLLVLLRPALRTGSDTGVPRGADLARALAIAVFLALALVPERLLHPLAAPGRFLAEWRREGGLTGPGGAGWRSVLSLAVVLGPLVWLGWVAAAWRDRRNARQLFVPAGTVLLCLGLPAVLGVARPGAVQWSVAPLLSAWAIGVPVSLAAGRPRLAGLATALALALVVSVVPARLALHRGAAASARAITSLSDEMSRLVKTGELVVAEADPFVPVAGDSSRAPAGFFVLPRDSRTPGRYDDLYWHRWYSGFRWVLLSGARTGANLARDDAPIPRAFYRAVEREGILTREWGEGDTGFRLYRIPDSSPWRRPLSEPEVAGLRPTPQRTWFLSSLGTLYLEAGEAPLAEELFRLATIWDPENVGAWNNLGAAFLRRSDYPAAAKAFDEGLKRAPGSFELLLNYGRTCSGQGLYERGEQSLLKAADLRPNYAPVHYELARVFLGLGKDAAAMAALRRTLELDPTNRRRAEIESLLAQIEEATKATPTKTTPRAMAKKPGDRP
jgi:hypothetical protein